jgi:hypothetical protein
MSGNVQKKKQAKIRLLFFKRAGLPSSQIVLLSVSLAFAKKSKYKRILTPIRG